MPACRHQEGRTAGHMSLRTPQLYKGLCALGMSDGLIVLSQKGTHSWKKESFLIGHLEDKPQVREEKEQRTIFFRLWIWKERHARMDRNECQRGEQTGRRRKKDGQNKRGKNKQKDKCIGKDTNNQGFQPRIIQSSMERHPIGATHHFFNSQLSLTFPPKHSKWKRKSSSAPQNLAGVSHV